jgi:hypothetical protein
MYCCLIYRHYIDAGARGSSITCSALFFCIDDVLVIASCVADNATADI